MAVEQVAEGLEFADAPFGGSGQVGLDDREAGEPGEGPPGAAGAALLDLDRPDCPLCFVVSEDVQVSSRSSDRSLPFFSKGLSDDGGRDDVDESRRPCRSSSSTRADKRPT